LVIQMYGFVDVNNMYVSCERLFNPRLDGQPVLRSVVLR